MYVTGPLFVKLTLAPLFANVLLHQISLQSAKLLRRRYHVTNKQTDTVSTQEVVFLLLRQERLKR